jgi:ATPase subunit of ABC transporter with duplicated ATPase domains
MCDPVSAGIATAVGAAASLAGTFMASKAAKENQQAIANQNRQMQVAQNEGFTQRLNAGLQQTAAQAAASQQTLADRGTAANQMRGMQTDALQPRTRQPRACGRPAMPRRSNSCSRPARKISLMRRPGGSRKPPIS